MNIHDIANLGERCEMSVTDAKTGVDLRLLGFSRAARVFENEHRTAAATSGERKKEV